MQYKNSSFSVSVGGEAYADGWDRIFGKGRAGVVEAQPMNTTDANASDDVACAGCRVEYPRMILDHQELCPNCSVRL
jgi:hypothetical protein